MGATILIRPDQTRPDSANYDLLFDKDYYRETLHINHFVDQKLTFRTIQDGYILPYCYMSTDGGIFDSEGCYVQGSNYTDINSQNINLSSLAEKCGMSVSEAVHKHETVIFIGMGRKVWGHFITDSMRLLWFLRSKEYRENFANCPLILFDSKYFELKGNWLRMFEILGINTSLVTPITELTKYDKIILPDECFFFSEGAYHFTSEYIEITDAVRNFAIAHSKPAHAKKIYYSCTKLRGGTSTAYGEDKLEKYFISKGYEIIYPEKLSLDEQLNALVHCESFASTIGSCSHNSIFLRDNTEVILIPRANYLTEYQLAIDQVHQQNIHYIDSSFSIFDNERPPLGPFLYFISSSLRKYFHDEDTESIVYLSDFWKYMLYVLGFKTSRKFGMLDFGVIDKADNPEPYKYYSVVAAEYFGKLVKTSWPYRIRQRFKKLLRRRK